MRSVIVHLGECREDDVTAFLDRAYPRRQASQWIHYVDGDACLYIEFYRDLSLEFEPAELDQVRAQFNGRLPLCVVADVSGRHEGISQVLQFVEMLLSRWPGVATDDYSDHLWRLEEIQTRVRIDGFTFFDHLEVPPTQRGESTNEVG